MNRIVLPFFLAALGTLHGQPVFEAASIKPAAPGRRGMGMNVSPGRIRIINSSLKLCIQMAWNVREFQVSGATGWMDTERYDIDAVAADRIKQDGYRAMLQALLTDRFGLTIHREQQERSGYALVAAKNGAKLPPATDDPDIVFGRTESGDRTLKAKSATLADLANALGTTLGAPVVDRTGIEGRFDVSLQWTPDTAHEPVLSKDGMPAPPPASDAPGGPGIITALQEKLGLKLETRKVPVEVIVIDGANRPSGN
jgi:uncharacterized protein (TIGR03435 family)